MRIIIIVLMLVAAIPIAYAAMNPAPAFCEHQGYHYDQISDSCEISENQTCPAWGFLRGECGQSSVKPIPCRKEGEYVFGQFEQCCTGLEESLGWWNPMLGQSSCEPRKNIFLKLWMWLWT